MAALLNRKLVSLTPERRTMPRVEVRAPAYVKWSQSLSLAALRNISARGLQLEGEELPPIGTFVSVFVEGLKFRRAKWSGGGTTRGHQSVRRAMLDVNHSMDSADDPQGRRSSAELALTP